MRCGSAGIDPENVERACGFLTKSERQYLIDEWDPSDDGSGYSQSQASRKRSDIKTRTRHALADLALLQEHADSDLKESVVKTNAEPAIFAPDTMDHMAHGMLKFANDATVGEEFSDALFEAMQHSDVNESALPILEAAMQGDEKQFFIALADLIGSAVEESELSENEIADVLLEGTTNG